MPDEIKDILSSIFKMVRWENILNISIGFCIIQGIHTLNYDGYGAFGDVYVNGDAYNYIINACKATAWFVLAVVFAILRLTTILKERLNRELYVSYKRYSDND